MTDPERPAGDELPESDPGFLTQGDDDDHQQRAEADALIPLAMRSQEIEQLRFQFGEAAPRLLFIFNRWRLWVAPTGANSATKTTRLAEGV
jgi:hypothetical protein